MLLLIRFFSSIYSCYIIIDKLQEPILSEKKNHYTQYSECGSEFNLVMAGKFIDLKRVGVTNAFKTSLGF